MDDEDYQAKIEELEEETDKLEDVFEKFKAQSEAQSEEFEKELQAFQAEIQDLQMQIDEKTQELEELNSIAHKSAREEVELKKKAKAIQQKIDTLAEDIRKLENECTSCRQSVRVGSAKNKNMSVSLRNSNVSEFGFSLFPNAFFSTLGKFGDIHCFLGPLFGFGLRHIDLHSCLYCVLSVRGVCSFRVPNNSKRY